MKTETSAHYILHGAEYVKIILLWWITHSGLFNSELISDN